MSAGALDRPVEWPDAVPALAHAAADADGSLARAWSALASVADPEIPVLSIVDLGIVRSVACDGEHPGGVRVGLSPTYSGCPATDVIRASAVAALEAAGFAPVTAIDVLSPPWTSDWITSLGRERLKAYGIAPPERPVAARRALFGDEPAVACPRCDSRRTTRISEFGSTPCKALWRCEACLEPFDHFKCL